MKKCFAVIAVVIISLCCGSAYAEDKVADRDTWATCGLYFRFPIEMLHLAYDLKPVDESSKSDRIKGLDEIDSTLNLNLESKISAVRKFDMDDYGRYLNVANKKAKTLASKKPGFALRMGGWSGTAYHIMHRGALAPTLFSKKDRESLAEALNSTLKNAQDIGLKSSLLKELQLIKEASPKAKKSEHFAFLVQKIEDWQNNTLDDFLNR